MAGEPRLHRLDPGLEKHLAAARRRPVTHAVSLTEDGKWVRCTLCVDGATALLAIGDNGTDRPQPRRHGVLPLLRPPTP